MRAEARITNGRPQRPFCPWCPFGRGRARVWARMDLMDMMDAMDGVEQVGGEWRRRVAPRGGSTGRTRVAFNHRCTEARACPDRSQRVGGGKRGPGSRLQRGLQAVPGMRAEARATNGRPPRAFCPWCPFGGRARGACGREWTWWTGWTRRRGLLTGARGGCRMHDGGAMRFESFVLNSRRGRRVSGVGREEQGKDVGRRPKR